MPPHVRICLDLVPHTVIVKMKFGSLVAVLLRKTQWFGF